MDGNCVALLAAWRRITWQRAIASPDITGGRKQPDNAFFRVKNEGMKLREPVVSYNPLFEAKTADIEAKNRYFWAPPVVEANVGDEKTTRLLCRNRRAPGGGAHAGRYIPVTTISEVILWHFNDIVLDSLLSFSG